MKNNSACFNSGMLWALTPQAELEYNKLIKEGIDADLAFLVLEQIFSEKNMFNFSGADNETS